jgi:hypothetical protein
VLSDSGRLQRDFRVFVTPKPVRGDWRISHLHRAFRNHSENFNRAPWGFKKPSIAFKKFPKISLPFWESRIINGLRANRGKKIAERAAGRTWGRAPPRPMAFNARECLSRSPTQSFPASRGLVLVHPNSPLPPRVFAAAAAFPHALENI